jgi:hypothetical protein
MRWSIFTGFALSLLTTVLFAQPYQSIFGKQSTFWVFQWQQSNAVLDTAFIAGDTLMKGHVYKKVLLASEAHGARVFGGGLLREDTSAGKVWYRGLYVLYGPGDTTERLAFDFSLQPGDTFDISGATFGASWGIPHDFKLVDSVRTIDGRRYIFFRGSWNWDYGNMPPEPFTFIEGIGSNVGVLSKLWPTSLLHPYLLCAYKEGIQTSYRNRSFSGACNPTLLSAGHARTAADVQLAPNPARDFVRISGASKNDVCSVEIFSSDGRRVLRVAPPANGQIPVSDLPEGIYFFRLFTSRGVAFQKLELRR